MTIIYEKAEGLIQGTHEQDSYESLPRSFRERVKCKLLSFNEFCEANGEVLKLADLKAQSRNPKFQIEDGSPFRKPRSSIVS